MLTTPTSYCIQLTIRELKWNGRQNSVQSTRGTRRQHMTKADLVEKIAEDSGISKAMAAKALESFIEGIGQALKKKDGKVTLVGFGSFSKIRRKARKGRNPQTGEEIRIKACNVVKFRPGKKLKDAV